MSRLRMLPIELQWMVLFPDVTSRTTIVDVLNSTSDRNVMTFEAMLAFHIWHRHIQRVASDVRRVRFFASTNGAALRIAKSHRIVRHELTLPSQYWQSVPPIQHLRRRIPPDALT